MPDGSVLRHPPRVAFYLPALYFGGAERVTLNLAGYIAARGWDVHMLLNQAKGELLDQVPLGVQVHGMAAERVSTALLPVARYLVRNRLDILIPSEAHVSVAALLARRLAGVHVPTVVAEHSVISTTVAGTVAGSWCSRTLGLLIRATYPMADALVTVSRGAAEDLRRVARLKTLPEVISNPVLSRGDSPEALPPPEDSWFAPGAPPVFVAAGRLRPVKGFATLIEAFALVRACVEARLVILGSGPMRQPLEDRIRALGLGDAVRLSGFAAEPMRYFRGAAAIVVPSYQESFGNVLVEAMACGRPVISTDCLGPREILDDGRYGTLVPVGDAAALAGAMVETLRRPVDAASLMRRADEYTVERCGQRWLSLLQATIPSPCLVSYPTRASGAAQ